MKSQANEMWDVIVIGGGPAGMMAAARAGERERSVLLLEKNTRLGVKLSMTGGGHCNVTNNKPDVRTMLINYKNAGKFLFSTFTQHGVVETITWFAEHGVPFYEKNDGRLFPVTDSAETVYKTLIDEMKKQGVIIQTRATVTAVAYDAGTKIFTITLSGGKVFCGHACIIATGGISRPETGSTGDGFLWANNFGHTVRKNSLALVPLTLKDIWIPKISGVVLNDIKISIYVDGKKHSSHNGKLLFTHVGVSGPTILNMSNTVKELLTQGEVILMLDLFSKLDEGALRTYIHENMSINSNRMIKNILPDLLPRSLITIILELLSIDGETLGHSVRSEDRAKLVSLLKQFPLHVEGLLGAEKAIISSGGVVLTEIDFKTMSSRLIPKLYLVGDVLDIDRPSGGYSLQLCWSTGYVAGSHV